MVEERRARGEPRGRVVTETARAEVRACLGTDALQRNMLLEYLHDLQNRYGYITIAHSAALADMLGCAEVEIYETASFYAHFDLETKDGRSPPATTIRVCTGVVCAQHGATTLHRQLQQKADPQCVRVLKAPCMGRCATAPAAIVRRHGFPPTVCAPATAETVAAAQHVPPPPPQSVSPAQSSSPDKAVDTTPDPAAYPALRRELAAGFPREALLAILEASGLRGLGGAGFPVARKWQAVLSHPGPRLVVINADEGEPGTFKDRFLIETAAPRVLEGALIAAHTLEASAVYIYLRDEYADLLPLLAAACARITVSGLANGITLHLRRGAGAYVCGEESALLESLEGKRGQPRHKPPYPAERGLFGRPTLVHNVETLYWVAEILARGPEFYAESGRNGYNGLRHISLSGRICKPGVYCAPIGITAHELITEYGEGMRPGHNFAAWLPGGASGGLLPASLAYLPLAPGVLEPHGAFVGSAAVVILSDHDSLPDIVRDLTDFFAEESCGQCVPCRLGTAQLARLLRAPRAEWNNAQLLDIAHTLRDASICGLGQATANPLLGLLRGWPE